MQRTQKLVNDPSKCVLDAVEGVLLSNSQLSVIEGETVIVRSDIHQLKEKQVTILSGGGSGHEPAHAGYIGDGMLAGAILGKVFASPSVNAILAAIRTCAGPKGSLLIIKNYTGDRLNFGMAAERAKSEGLKVEMVIVDDDVALAEGKGITGGRGVAGTVLVHKLAGCAAMNGASLEQVAQVASQTASKVKTLGAALTVCTVPGCAPTNRLNDESIEMAIGIHAEPGQVEDTSLMKTSLSSYVSTRILNRILGDGISEKPRSSVEKGDEVAVLINNLGGTSELEMLVFTKDVMNNLLQREIKPVRCYVGSFMTSLEMTGVSVSLLPCDWMTLSALDTPTTAPGWKKSMLTSEAKLISQNDRTIPYPGAAEGGNEMFAHIVTTSGGGSCTKVNPILCSICSKIIEIEPLLTDYDSKCGDGDCGLTMKSAAEHILKLASQNKFNTEDSAMCCSQLAYEISESMGGTSGAIFEIMLRAMASYLHGKPSPSDELSSLQLWAQAIEVGTAAITKYGGAEEGMRTLLDALCPASRALLTESAKKDHQDVSSSSGVVSSSSSILSSASEAARAGMESTKTMPSLAGRSNYVAAESMEGIPDPGAVAVFTAFQAVASVLSSV